MAIGRAMKRIGLLGASTCMLLLAVASADAQAPATKAKPTAKPASPAAKPKPKPASPAAKPKPKAKPKSAMSAPWSSTLKSLQVRSPSSHPAPQVARRGPVPSAPSRSAGVKKKNDITPAPSVTHRAAGIEGESTDLFGRRPATNPALLAASGVKGRTAATPSALTQKAGRETRELFADRAVNRGSTTPVTTAHNHEAEAFYEERDSARVDAVAAAKAARAQHRISETAGLHANAAIPRIRVKTRKAPNPRGMMMRGLFGGGLGSVGAGFNPLNNLQRNLMSLNGFSSTGN
jgi:hypothetical protein